MRSWVRVVAGFGVSSSRAGWGGLGRGALFCFWLVVSGIGIAQASVGRGLWWGTTTGRFPDVVDGADCTVGFGWTCALNLFTSTLQSEVPGGWGDYVYMGQNGMRYAPSDQAITKVLGVYAGCRDNQTIDGVTTTGRCVDNNNYVLVGRVWAECPVGAAETEWYQTTIGSGSLLDGFSPATPPPTEMCSGGCVVNVGSLTYRAMINPGEWEVGAPLWVEVNTQVTAGQCLPGFDAMDVPATVPGTACDPATGLCGGGGTPVTPTGGLTETESANLASIATNTANTAGAVGVLKDQVVAEGVADRALLSEISGKLPACGGEGQPACAVSQAEGDTASSKASADAAMSASRLSMGSDMDSHDLALKSPPSFLSGGVQWLPSFTSILPASNCSWSQQLVMPGISPFSVSVSVCSWGGYARDLLGLALYLATISAVFWTIFRRGE